MNTGWTLLLKVSAAVLLVLGPFALMLQMHLVHREVMQSNMLPNVDRVKLQVAHGGSGEFDFEQYLDHVPELNEQVYSNGALQSSWADPVSEVDALHLSLLHETCVNRTDTILPWSFASSGNVSSDDMNHILHRDDPDLYNKIRQCPDVDIYLPVDIRGHGYCEDAVAYLKYLESRLLPHWVFTETFVDPVSKRKYSYYELCPSNAVIFFNHYWNGLPDSPDWPSRKPVYMMPNIEMYETRAKHYWRADMVLCKTAVCARRVKKWYEQEGNPRNAHVLYTRHTSSNIGVLAQSRMETREKDFTNMTFTHAIGHSIYKGTDEVIGCWLDHPEFPLLNVYMMPDFYDGYRQRFGEKRLETSPQLKMHVGTIDEDDFGKIVAESAYMVCTSTMEGYGHYINQARATGAAIVTTDLPPMNELLSSDSAQMVRITPASDRFQFLSGKYMGEHGLKAKPALRGTLKASNVCDGVQALMARSVEDRMRLGENARKQYAIDLRFFAAKMRELRAYVQGRKRVRPSSTVD